MTTVYFVRHAQPDLSVHDDLTRPLTEKGLQDRKKVTDYFRDNTSTKLFLVHSSVQLIQFNQL